MDTIIKEIKYGSKEYEDTIKLRNEVFRKPWGLDIKDDDLSDDKNMIIYGAFIDRRLIGTVFLSEYKPDIARVRNVAIYKEYQGMGIGRKLMDFIEDLAKNKGYKKSFLMGRISAESFYKKLGYKTLGEPYDYKTIPHVDMIKDL